MKTEKKYLMYGIAIILLTLIGVSFAYFVTEIVGSSKTVSVSTGDLRIVFTDTDGSITGDYIEPGWSETKTFSVENKTNSDYKYNIVIEDLVNTFSTTGYLVYKITSTDGGYNMTDYVDVPKSKAAKDTVLAYSISIPSKTTHNYTIEIKYLNDEENSQNIDMNSILSGNIYIAEGTILPTITEAILRDNPIISERTDFSVTNVADTTGTVYKATSTEDGSEIYYYSGNTTNNWVKFGKENKTSCTYNGEKVYYLGDEESISNMFNDSKKNPLVENENDCTRAGVCSIDGSNMFFAGFESLEECKTLFSKVFGYTSSEFESQGWFFSYYDDKPIWKEWNADIFWRIIRTNEDGSIRLLYAGISHGTSEGYIMEEIQFNDSSDESRYVGYMYGGNTSLVDNRTNTTDSKIKGVIDTWYQNNLLTNYDKYISKSAIYCNDRSAGSGTWVNTGTTFYFGAYTRLNTNKLPTYKCGGNTSGGLFESTQATQDKFSASTSSGGNGQLTYPIALMTADEVSFAGGKFDISNLPSTYPYYYTNSVGSSITDSYDWWLLSPYQLYSSVSTNTYVYKSLIRNSSVSKYRYMSVRPVLSINPCAKVTGTGTPEDPYIIDESASTC